MSWNLLAFGFPVLGILNTLGRVNPASYKPFDEMPQSGKDAEVRAIAERVLNAEYVRGSEHFQRIDEMLKELPESVGPKTIQSLLSYRLKVVETQAEDFPVFTTGTDSQDGKYYIGIKPDREIEKALPWFVTHELSHILNDDTLALSIAKVVAALGAAAISTLVLDLSLPASLGAVLLTNCATHAACSQRSERTADDFAIKHCSRKELKSGVAFLELIKERREKGIYSNNPITWILHPSEDSRIAKIRAALGAAGKVRAA